MITMQHVKFYLDFDGTIAETDVTDMVLERFAAKEWQDVERLWQAGEIGSRECLSRQIALLKATPADLEKLCHEVKVDRHFIPFLLYARSIGVPVRVVSDGFDFIIKRVLARELREYPMLVADLPIHSNKLEWTPAGPRAVFNEEICHHGCANCKPEVIKDTAMPDESILFVGDGLSDRYAASISNVTFAKSKLLTYCRENDLHHVPYEHFGQVEEWLRKNHELLRNRHVTRPTLS